MAVLPVPVFFLVVLFLVTVAFLAVVFATVPLAVFVTCFLAVDAAANAEEEDNAKAATSALARIWEAFIRNSLRVSCPFLKGHPHDTQPILGLV